MPNCETMSDSSGPSLWEWTVPDEGYCTGKDHELPEMIDSARKELECPICMEIMAPPSRIWQCRVSYKYRYTQLLRIHHCVICYQVKLIVKVNMNVYVYQGLSTRCYIAYLHIIYSIQSLNRGHTYTTVSVLLFYQVSVLRGVWCQWRQSLTCVATQICKSEQTRK